ncbi:MAG TPA: hypothetical protein DCF84_03340 [Bacteroidetes bacterium]|nr:hypothetical protein [Bacteroidota bacterium]|tara:strand:- start:638 stop:1168 length:531 start_codon:yes stop_codon:yes gene_type:complete
MKKADAKPILMKKIFILPIAILLLAITACQDDLVLDNEPLKNDGIQGDWVLSIVEMQDYKAINISDRNLDVSYVFTEVAQPTAMSFNSADFTFTYNGGDNPSFLPESGTWRFVNTSTNDWSANYPDELHLIAGGDTTELALAGPVRPQDEYLQFTIRKNCPEDNQGYGYLFKFVRQ